MNKFKVLIDQSIDRYRQSNFGISDLIHQAMCFFKWSFKLNKVSYIRARFKEIGDEVRVSVPTGEMEKGFLGSKPVMREEVRWNPTGVSDCLVDGLRLAKDIQDEVEALNNIGYEVVTLQPTISGTYFGGSDMGYGFSYTEGVTIISRKSQATK